MITGMFTSNFISLWIINSFSTQLIMYKNIYCCFLYCDSDQETHFMMFKSIKQTTFLFLMIIFNELFIGLLIILLVCVVIYWYFILIIIIPKIGNMLMSSKQKINDDIHSGKQKKTKINKNEEQTDKMRILMEEPIDWILKNEKVASMLTVCFVIYSVCFHYITIYMRSLHFQLGCTRQGTSK